MYHLIHGVHRLGQALARHGTRGHQPARVGGRLQLRHAHGLGDLLRAHGGRQVLLVGDHQGGQDALGVLRAHQTRELHARLLRALTVAAVHDEEDAVGRAQVGLPQGPHVILAAYVPDDEADAARLALDGRGLHCLAVEADGGDGAGVLAELEPVEQGRLARALQPHHDHLYG